MTSFIGALQRHRWWVLALLLLSIGWVGLGLNRIGVDNSLEVWFPEGDPEIEAYHTFLDTFGNDETLVVGVRHPDGQSLISPQGLERVEDISNLILDVDGISQVLSLSHIDVLKSGMPIDVGRLWGDVVDERDIPGIREQINADPLLRSFVGKDEKLVLILAQMAAMDNIDSAREAVFRDVRDRLEDQSFPVVYGGIGVVYDALNQASTRGSVIFIVASYGLIAFLLWVFFRRVGAMLLTLGVVGLSATTLMGLFGLLGSQINMVNMILPTIVLVIGVSSCVHMLVHVVTASGEAQEDRAQNGVSFVFWPCLLNTVTTCMGFLALGTASMPVIQELGYYGALGLIIAFCLSVVLCGIGASWKSCVPNPIERGVIRALVEKLSELAIRSPREVLCVAGVVALLALLGITRLQVDTYSIDFLKSNHPVRIDSEILEQDYGPYTPLEFVVSPVDLEGDPEVLLDIMEDVAIWQDRLNQHPEVGFSRSLVDLPRRVNQLLNPDTVRALPREPNALAQLLFLLSMNADTQETIDRFYDAESHSLRITVGVPMLSAKGFEHNVRELVNLAEMRHAVIEPSGYIPLYIRMMDHIVRAQLQSFGFAFVVIFLAVALLFRSIRMAVLSIPANLLPVLMTLGLMGLLGIRLDVATVTIAAIVLGLVVDDTIQFLYRYQYERGRCESEQLAVERTVKRVGRPMTITTLVLGLGFSVLGFAAVKSVAFFGLLLAFALVSALFSDLLVVPALIVLLGPPLKPQAVSNIE